MAEITIQRTDEPAPTEAEKAALRRVLFGVVKGASQDDAKAWNRFWKRLFQLEPGELCMLDLILPRIGPFHRRWMVFETALFESQERFDNRDTMRDWIKIASGFCEWCPGAKGGVVPIPRSVSYRKADQLLFEKFVDGAVEFCKTEHFAKFLWKHASAESRDALQAELIGEYEEWLHGPGLMHRAIAEEA